MEPTRSAWFGQWYGLVESLGRKGGEVPVEFLNSNSFFFL